ncbi:uncharacterized protein C20orf96-like [Dreissena polymorpha]|uniref:Uncharacterized protein n=1 Tax=Dreissena polymorpha TaxID=45954 RepID=A0A9D4E5X8_DREPO|nr:uncharacterized protein C20orf96-like [Dreissena polymorpha]XP_052230950.1 uncharacterized protein C20orf96-like [Dreissena polymorpha]KAH3774489.1 hypothetical protein DPMN_175871 [Dreissena polymorpha]
MAASWGKRATSRVERSQFENDELLQQLGTQFDVTFTDYDKWTRKAKLRPTVQEAAKEQARRAASAESCHHGQMTYREKKEHAKKQEEEKERAERMKMLELRIKTRKMTLDEYDKRYAELIEQNIILRDQIEVKETGTLDHVKGLLRRYEKYRGGISTLNAHFNREYAQAKQDLADAEKRLKKRQETIENEVNELDQKLKTKQEELHVLLNYKDKEYPVKAMIISNLQKEFQTKTITYDEDQEELEHITRTELSKYEKEKQMTQNKITKQVTESAIEMMHPSLKDMALQNMVMEKEIELHKKQQEELQKQNSELEKTVKDLLRDPKTNLRQQMFPEFFLYQQKCTPDMEVVLDIPKQEWLPI